MILGRKSRYAVPHLDNKGNYSETHVQVLDEIMETNKKIKNAGYQYTRDRSMKLMCRIPALQFIKYGHKFMSHGVIDEKALIKWLDSKEGEHCKVNKGSAKNV